MDTTLLIQSITQHIEVNAPMHQYLQSVLQVKKIKKKHFLLQEGDVAKYSVFVNNGLLRLYAIDKNGYEHNIQFAPDGWWITDLQSNINQAPAHLFIDAIEDSELLLLQHSELEELFHSYPLLERYFRIIAENALAAYQQRIGNNLSLSAKERYQQFCELYPTLIRQLPQKHIASYIGVTPEFLSKMLNQSMLS